MILLADAGGTNTRFALARHGGVIASSTASLRGADYASFDDAMQHYLRGQGQPRLQALCIAVAGPVAGGRARLTNRDWHLSEDHLMRQSGARRALLINDLVALGHAVPGLTGNAVRHLRKVPAAAGRSNGQALVVNAGTGFNICAVQVSRQGRIACLESEYGHTRLPQSAISHLQSHLPVSKATAFRSVEEVLAGRGLVRLHQLRVTHGLSPDLRAEDIVLAACQGDRHSILTCRLHAALMGLICRELALLFLPQDGLYLAGSVARSSVACLPQLTRAFLAAPLMRQIVQATPLLLIEDDMAAIRGCLAALG